MNKFMKKVFPISLAVMMLLIPVIPVNAAETPDKEIVVSEEYAKSQKMLRYGEMEKVTLLNTEYRTTTVTPSGQPAEGFSFPTGGSVFVNTSGGPSMSVSFSVSWGAVGASVSLGIAGKQSSIGGYMLPAPNRTDYFKAKIDKRYKIERHKVDVYQYNEYKYTYYTSPVSLASESPYLVKAN